MKNFTLKKAVPFIALMFFFPFLHAQDCNSGTDYPEPINEIIGDFSFISKFGCLPDERTDEDLRIKTHLEYAENFLRKKDTSDLTDEQKLKRTCLLDLLKEYHEAGIFPRNYDHESRKPCFIDKDDRICAVGYLVEHTAGLDVAYDINSKFKYAHVMEMNAEIVDNWIASSGFTKEEIATIQPDYGGWGNPCPNNKIYTCRWNDCLYECKCLSQGNAAQWQQNGQPCDTTDTGGNGNGNGNGGYGNGNGNGNNFSGGFENIMQFQDGSFVHTEYAFPYVVHPNPANAYTTVSIYLEREEAISIKVLDLSGKVIADVAEEKLGKGIHNIHWHTGNAQSGIYLIKYEAGAVIQVDKISVVK